MSEKETASVVVYPGDRYAALPGDYTAMRSDGVRRCLCVSVHQSMQAAMRAADTYRHADANADD